MRNCFAGKAIDVLLVCSVESYGRIVQVLNAATAVVVLLVLLCAVLY